MRTAIWWAVVLGIASVASGAEETPRAWPVVDKVEGQPLDAQVARLKDALAFIGSPLGAEASRAIEAARGGPDEALTKAVQQALDPLCLAAVTVGREGRVRAAARGGRPVLVAQGWRTYLIKVVNQAGAAATLTVQSPNARPVPGGPRDDIKNRWLDLAPYDARPMTPRLGGLGLEY